MAQRYSDPRRGYGVTAGSGSSDDSFDSANNGSFNHNFSHEFLKWYENAVAELRGTAWESQIPELNGVQYSPSFWGAIGGAIGINSEEANFWNTQAMNIQETMQKLLDAKRAQEYNTPANQIARENAAGINSQLAGGEGISSGEASEVSDTTPNGVPLAEGDNGVASGAQFVISSAMSIITSGVSLAQGIEGFAHAQSMNSIAEMKELMDTVGGANSFLANLTPSEDWTDPATGALVKAGTPLQASQVDAYVDSLGLRPNAKKMLKHMLGRVRYDENGNPTTGYTAKLNELQRDSLNAADEVVKLRARPGYSSNLSEWSANYSKLTADANQEILTLQLEYQQELLKLQKRLVSGDVADAQVAAAQKDC